MAANLSPRKPRTIPKRMYSVDERATILAALDANHGNLLATARQFGIRHASLQRILQSAQADTDRAARVRQLRLAKSQDLADSFNDLAWAAVQQAADKLPEASARDAAVIAGIAVDKRLILSGLPTVITARADDVLKNVTPEQLSAIRAVLAGQVPDQVTAPALSATTEPATTDPPVNPG